MAILFWMALDLASLFNQYNEFVNIVCILAKFAAWEFNTNSKVAIPLSLNNQVLDLDFKV